MILSGIPLEISRGNCDGVFFSENAQDASEEINVRNENLIADGETRQEVRSLRIRREWAERQEQERLQILRDISEYLANEEIRGNDVVNENDVTSVPSTVELTASTISNLDSATQSFNIPETIDLPADMSVSSTEIEGFSCGDSNQSIDVVRRNNGVDSESLLTFEGEESLGENPYPSLRAYLAFEREENSMVENNPVNEEEIVNNIPSSSADKTSQEEVDVSSASSLPSNSTQYFYSDKSSSSQDTNNSQDTGSSQQNSCSFPNSSDDFENGTMSHRENFFISNGSSELTDLFELVIYVIEYLF